MTEQQPSPGERNAGRAPGPDTFDVIIVGYGPAGVAAANLAGLAGLRTVVVERDADLYLRQRAISIDAEALRIIRNLGLHEQVTSRMHRGVTVKFLGMDGRPFLTAPPMPTEHCGDAQANFFHQPWLEESLREGVARFPHVEVRTGWEALDLTQSDGVVQLGVRDLATGEERVLRGDYLLACDGGSSPIRKQLGVPFAGDSYSEQWMDVQARVKNPLHTSPHFEFFCSPDRPGVKCPCPGGHHRWEWRINPGEDPEEMLKPERIAELLSSHGVDMNDIEITRSWTYTFHVRKCAQWRVGRVFFVGDAAHVMPPFAGQGVSGAFRDASNLMWKIVAVMRGQAADEILDTYQEEREPHHDAMTASAVNIGKLVMPPNRATARLRDSAFRLLGRVPGAENAISRRIIAPAPLKSGYLEPFGKGSAVGHLIKAVEVAQPGVHLTHLDTALGAGWAVLGLNRDPAEALPPDVLAAWEAFGAHFFTVRPGTSVVEEGELGDPVGTLWEWMQQHHADFVIVRPDRYVYAASSNPEDLPEPRLAARDRDEGSTRQKDPGGCPEFRGTSVAAR